MLLDLPDLQTQLGIQIAERFNEVHGRVDIPNSPFRIGQLVRVKKTGFMGKITSMNEVNRDEFEYALEDHPYLVWDFELEGVE